MGLFSWVPFSKHHSWAFVFGWSPDSVVFLSAVVYPWIWKRPNARHTAWCSLMFPALIWCWFPVAFVHLSPAVSSSERVLHHLHTALPTVTVGLSSLFLSQLSAQVLLVREHCIVFVYGCAQGHKCFQKVGNRRCPLWITMHCVCYTAYIYIYTIYIYITIVFILLYHLLMWVSLLLRCSIFLLHFSHTQTYT